MGVNLQATNYRQRRSRFWHEAARRYGKADYEKLSEEVALGMEAEKNSSKATKNERPLLRGRNGNAKQSKLLAGV